MPSRRSKDEYSVVCAIDFGTTFSGYAYSFKASPEEIQINKNWTSSAGFQVWLLNFPHVRWHIYGSYSILYSVKFHRSFFSLQSFKTATSVLMSEDDEFEDFGFYAEELYSQAVEHGGPRKSLFRNFKMLLHEKEVRTGLCMISVLPDYTSI